MFFLVHPLDTSPRDCPEAWQFLWGPSRNRTQDISLWWSWHESNTLTTRPATELHGWARSRRPSQSCFSWSTRWTRHHVTVLRPGNFWGVRPGIEPRTSRSGSGCLWQIYFHFFSTTVRYGTGGFYAECFFSFICDVACTISGLWFAVQCSGDTLYLINRVTLWSVPGWMIVTRLTQLFTIRGMVEWVFWWWCRGVFVARADRLGPNVDSHTELFWIHRITWWTFLQWLRYDDSICKHCCLLLWLLCVVCTDGFISMLWLIEHLATEMNCTGVQLAIQVIWWQMTSQSSFLFFIIILLLSFLFRPHNVVWSS